MMLRYSLIVLFLLVQTISNSQSQPVKFSEILKDSPSIEGKEEYLSSPFVTAGKRLYIVGHQDGGFPELGWHIKDEMGGIWNHPIKLFDGFEVELTSEGTSKKMDKSEAFINYPFASEHIYSISEWYLQVHRYQFVPEEIPGLAIQFQLVNNSDQTRDIALSFNAFSDLRPTWLGERTQMLDDKDLAKYEENHDRWVIKDSSNNWFAVYGSDRKPLKNASSRNNYQGKGTDTSLKYELSISPRSNEQLTIYISGSNESYQKASDDYKFLINNLTKEINDKKAKFEELANNSKLTIPDKKLEQTFEWLKYNSAWLVQDVPGIGSGITAGIPDYPWWFGVDSEYALKGYMAIGQSSAVYNTIKLLDSVSAATNGNGKIIHEMSTNGAVFNDGNINETPQFASLIWEIYKWNGDKEFLKSYFPTIKAGLEWLLKENDSNNNLFPDGFGMMEIHGLDSEMIDVAVYTQKAFDDASKIAFELKMDSIAQEYQTIGIELKDKINNEFWSEEFGSYADFIGTDAQALRLIDDAITRADTLNKPWSVTELKNTKEFINQNPSDSARPFVLHHNWVVNTPMEMNIADPDKAKIALKTAETYTNPFGVFVTGIDRDESSVSDAASFKGSKVFSYTGAVMTLPTGVQAIAENNYGNPDKALDYLKRMTRSFSYAFPGSMYEVSPDYGMITQAWNIYSFAIPIVQQFFGIQPMAAKKQVLIKPQLPSEWNHAALENVLMADNEVSVYYETETNGRSIYRIEKTNTAWTVKLVLPFARYEIISEGVSKTQDGDNIIFESSKNTVVISKLSQN
ncbi:glycogen debranching protein [Christiangramia salexigens]|uniref:Glycogen debranching protein n=1 Tax=Christiangramia salexigens TaxID=1913577 RepID=A0A1L3J2Q5_9FLAO|nr:glycogen debranching protein [Christiangramia salexigens]APG59400.1 glycogen debranching protein [Christiangramia salexigens]